jgi:hypothetical protein
MILPEHLNETQFGSINASGSYLQLTVKSRWVD